jgi:hypothetical protein
MKKYYIILFICMLIFSGCSQFKATPVPKEFISYIGTWKGICVHFTLTPDGRVSYEKISVHGKFSINAPLKEISATSIKIGI